MSLKEKVAVANIEGALNRLYEAQREKIKVKACLFNLIIYTDEARRTTFFSSVIHSIIEKFPCRILFIQGERTLAQDKLEVSVSNETVTRGNTLVACDQIIIEASASQLANVPFIILPHLIPDLPVYLLWGQDPTRDNEILPHLETFATRLIFDAECSNDLQQFMRKIIIKLNSCDIDVMDMNWALSSGWRDVLSQVFQTAESLEQLKDAKTIKVSYNNKKTAILRKNSTQAIYFSGWMAARLNWAVEEVKEHDDSAELHCHGPNGPITLEIHPEIRETLQSGVIFNVEITTYQNHQFSIIRKEQLLKALVHISNQERCAIPYSLPLPNVLQSMNFIKEVFHARTSTHYRAMLEKLANTKWNKA